MTCFDRALEINPRNVAAYMGNALAYEQLEVKEKVLHTLTVGIENTENDVLPAMMSVQRGKSLADHYNLVASDEKLYIVDSPFQTLEILGSDFYQWDFSACASVFGFCHEDYAGKG